VHTPFSLFLNSQSHTLEENLSRMERKGTLPHVIQAAKDASSKSNKRKTGSGASRFLSHLQTAPVRRSAHDDTTIISTDPPGADLAHNTVIRHSTTM
jgi:hypothetical protein